MEHKVREDRSISANRLPERIAGESSQGPLGAGSFRAQKNTCLEQETIEDISWNELSSYSLNYFESAKGCARKLSEILKINKILEVYEESIITKKKPLIDHPELNPLLKIKAHMQLIKEEKFAWETVVEDLDELLGFLKPTVSKFSSSFDVEFSHHRTIQILFPLKLIYLYMGRVDRNYGKPVYDKTLRIQNCLAEIFLYHHLKADAKFAPRLGIDELPGTSVLYRNRVRILNREDSDLKTKYFKTEYNLKEVIFLWLDLYFPNVSWRYIGGGQELHRLILQSILTLFELGLWEPADMERLLITLFQKLENLAVLERRSYSDFLSSLVNYPLFVSTLKEYFFECKEIVAAICLHMIYLTSDERILATKNVAWSPSTPSSLHYPILYRILTNYLLQFGGDCKNGQERWRKRPGLRDKISRICALGGFETADEYSRGGLGQDIGNDAIRSVIPLKTQLIKIIGQLASPAAELPTEELIALTSCMEMPCLSGEGPSDNYKQAAAVQRIPFMLLATISLLRVRQEEALSKLENKAAVYLVEICSDNLLAMNDLLSESAIKLWQSYIEIDPLVGMGILDRMFIGRSLMHFKHNQSMIDKLLALTEQASTKFSQLLELPKQRNPQTETFSWVMDKWTTKLAPPQSKSGKSLQGEEASVAGDKSDKITEIEISSPSKSIDVSQQPGSHSLIHDVISGLLIHALGANLLGRINTFIQQNCRGLSPLSFSFKIQEFLGEKCTRFYGAFLSSPEFTAELSQVDSKLPLQDPQRLWDIIVNKKAEPCQMSFTHSELRIIIINSAVSTVEVLAESTSGLFSHELFTQCGKEDGLIQLLESTEHLLQIGTIGLRARTAVLKLITNMFIFPGNGLVSNRLHEFNEGPGSNKEQKIPASHLNVATFNSFRAEIEFILAHETPDKCLVNTGYLASFLQLIYKFLSGIYVRYTKDSRVDYLHKNVLEICQKVDEIVKSCCHFEFDTCWDPKLKLRQQDSEEKANPKLRELRLGIDSCLQQLQPILKKISQQEVSNYYSRPTPALIKSSILEPWQETMMDKLLMENNKSIWDIEVISSGESENIISRQIFSEYDKSKNQTFYQKSENSLMYFLQASESRMEAFLTFYGRLNEALLAEAISKREVATNDPECFLNIDRLSKAFFKSEGIRWLIRFMCKALKEYPVFQMMYQRSLSNQLSLLVPEMTRGSLSSLRVWMDYLGSILLNKTFFDTTYKKLKVEFLYLGEFFKVLTYRNNQELKKILNQFAPKISGIVHFNESQKGICFNLYVRQETAAVSLDVWKNASKMLELVDRPEDFDLLITYASIVSEYCSGPCLVNQKEVYKYRGDTWFGIIGRQVENVNSSLNGLRLVVIKGILSNLEGKDPDIATYYGSNCTFDNLLDLIHSALKRLYIYLAFSVADHSCNTANKIRGLYELYRQAEIALRPSKKAKKLQYSPTSAARKRSFDYYGIASDEDEDDKKGVELSDEELMLEQTDNIRIETTEDFLDESDLDPQVIPEVVMKYLKLDDPELILDTLLQHKELVREHPLFKVSEALLQLITIISCRVPSFSICLDSANMKLLEKYRADHIPDAIKSKYKSHLEPTVSAISYEANNSDKVYSDIKQPDYAVKEKLLFYLVLTKFIEQISPKRDAEVNKENRTGAYGSQTEIEEPDLISSVSVVSKIETFLSDMQDIVEQYKKVITSNNKN